MYLNERGEIRLWSISTRQSRKEMVTKITEHVSEDSMYMSRATNPKYIKYEAAEILLSLSVLNVTWKCLCCACGKYTARHSKGTPLET
jgi:hypothetical protein